MSDAGQVKTDKLDPEAEARRRLAAPSWSPSPPNQMILTDVMHDVIQ